MEKRICLLITFIFYCAFVFSQNPELPPDHILQLEGVLVHNKPITIDAKLISSLSYILSKDFEIPFAIFDANAKGTGRYKMIPQPDKVTTVVTSIQSAIDSICMKQIKKEEFLKNLPFSYRAVKEITFLIAVDLEQIPAKRINTLPLRLFGDSYHSLDTTKFSTMLSEKKEYAKVKKTGKASVYEIQMNDENYSISSGDRYAARGKNKFTVDGTIWSIMKISRDSTLIFSRQDNCCDPIILTEYALSNGTLSVSSRTELYGLNKYFVSNDLFKIRPGKNNARYHYLKMSNDPLTFLSTPPCSCPNVLPPASVAGVKPRGNAIGLLRGNAIIYHLINSKLDKGFYGLVGITTDLPYKVYVGGWME